MVTINASCLKEANAYFVQPLIAGLTSAGAIALGHVYTAFMSTAVLHGGLFGLFQSAIAFQITQRSKHFAKNHSFAKYFIAHLITGAALYAVSLLAFKVGLLASVMTLTGAATVMAVSAAMGFLTMLCGNVVINKVEACKS